MFNRWNRGDPCSIGVAFLWAAITDDNNNAYNYEHAMHKQKEFMQYTVPRLDDGKPLASLNSNPTSSARPLPTRNAHALFGCRNHEPKGHLGASSACESLATLRGL